MLWIGQVAVVTLPAEIDVTIADAVRDELLAVLDQGATLLIADLSKTEFCDSAGVSALVRTYRRAGTSGSAMRLVVSTPAVQRVLVDHRRRPAGGHISQRRRVAGGHAGRQRAGRTQAITATCLPPRPIPTAAPRRRPSSNGGAGCGGSPVTLVTTALAISRSFTLLFCEAERRIANARCLGAMLPGHDYPEGLINYPPGGERRTQLLDQRGMRRQPYGQRKRAGGIVARNSRRAALRPCRRPRPRARTG